MNKNIGIIIKIVSAVIMIFILINIQRFGLKVNSTIIHVYLFLVVSSLLSDRFFYSGQKSENQVTSKNTSNALAICWFSAILIPIIEYSIYSREKLLVTIIGITMVCTGTLFRGISIRTLGNFFSRDVEKWNNHRVIDSGVYKKIRHPAYLGNIVQVIGFPLVLNSYLCLTLSLITIVTFIWRIKVEEEFLKNEFPEYVCYTKRTNRLIPGIW
ncbi:methyltransferase family protein [Fusibacter sp. JL216-2]|uniref:methyltransferase family protein n=1 Tax=Fusibacter sp. JL216-2 TaxID=3071453 RepID=UPI003D359756